MALSPLRQPSMSSDSLSIRAIAGLLDILDTTLYGIVGNLFYGFRAETSKFASKMPSFMQFTRISLAMLVVTFGGWGQSNLSVAKSFILPSSTPPRYTNVFPDATANTSKQLVLADRAYEPQIKTIQLYPSFGTRENELLPAVVPLGQPNLLLEFDDLDRPVERFYARVIHCNKDWTASGLAALEYMTEYNEFPITDYEFSENTAVPYVHYRFPVPAVRLPGNYVLVVYRDGNKDDLILSKRFM